MNRRLLLRSQLSKAWREAVTEDYQAQKINSERSLQASYWSRLNRLLHPRNRRLFIEPCMTMGARGRRFPDIVVCNTRSIIGIVELKYQPRVAPSWQKDVDTFAWIAQNRRVVTVSNSRFRGLEVDSKEYPIARDALFVWAGVHAGLEGWIHDRLLENIADCFLELHVETSHDGDIRISAW